MKYYSVCLVATLIIKPITKQVS